MEKKIILLAFLLPIFTQAQVNYGISLQSGISNIRLIDNDEATSTSNYFHAKPMYLGYAFIQEHKENCRFFFEQGLSFERFSYEINIPWKVYNELVKQYPSENYQQHWPATDYQITIPLFIKYEFEPWLSFYTGVGNVFHVSEKSAFINHFYTLRGELGADATIKKKYIIGLNGTYDITTGGQYDNYKIFGRYYSASLKLGMVLGEFKKKQK